MQKGTGVFCEDEKLPRCLHCKVPAVRLVSESPKPSWSVLLDQLDPRCPDWFAELDFHGHCRCLMEAHGVDDEDWYLETQIERAMNPLTSRPIQLYFPGMCPARDFLVELF